LVDGESTTIGETHGIYNRSAGRRRLSGLPHSLWSEMIMSAIRILNTTPKQRLNGKTPHEMAYGEKSHLGHLRIIGSKAYVNIPPEKREKGDKMSSRASIGWLVVQESSGIFGVIPATNDVIRTRDVLVDEGPRRVPGPTGRRCDGSTD
jgi:hypothetical protein